MEQQVNAMNDLTNDQLDTLRALLDSEVVLIGGGEAIGCLN